MEEFLSLSSIYIQIVPSTIQINLIEYDIPMITHDYRENLILNPGKYSIDPKTMTFNANVSLFFVVSYLMYLLLAELEVFLLLSVDFEQSVSISILRKCQEKVFFKSIK
jgi:hypothetical protein